MIENASVPPHTMWTLLLCGVRYAMGRRTGVVSEMSRYVRVHHKSLDVWHRAQIAREIREEIERYERLGHGKLGADCDHKDWVELAEFLEAL